MTKTKTQINKLPNLQSLITISIIASLIFIAVANLFSDKYAVPIQKQPTGFENISQAEAEAWNKKTIKEIIEDSEQTTTIESKDSNKDSLYDNDSNKEAPQTITVQAQEATVDSDVKTNKDSMTDSETKARLFKLYNGEFVAGSVLIEKGKNNPNALKLWQAFADRFGADIADIAIISLYYENSTYNTNTVGVCNPIHQINGDYRNCVYADLNSAGMDVGLKQINTFYQAERITKLGGQACNFIDSKDRRDPCNQKKIEWLLDINNNIKISLDIYQEQGFKPWYGYQKAFF